MINVAPTGGCAEDPQSVVLVSAGGNKPRSKAVLLEASRHTASFSHLDQEQSDEESSEQSTSWL